MSPQIETISKEIEIMERNQLQILELKGTITETKSSLQGHKKFEQAEERNHELEDGSTEIYFVEQQEKRMKKYEQSLTDLWDTIKCNII